MSWEQEELGDKMRQERERVVGGGRSWEVGGENRVGKERKGGGRV